MATKPVELLLVGFDTALESQLAESLGHLASVGASVPDPERTNDLHNGHPCQIVLIRVDDDPARGFAAVQRMSLTHPQRPVVVVSRSKDPDQVRQAMRVGARDYAVLAGETGAVAIDELVQSVERLAHELAAGAGGGRVVSVVPAKGGCGATALASNLAGMARFRRDLRVLLLDVNVQRGDCLLFLDLQPRCSIADALRSLPRLDDELLDGLVTVHPSSGIHVLAQPDRVEDWPEVTPERVGALLRVLTRRYDLIVVDGLRAVDDMAVAALDASDEILLVLTQDLPALKNARRCLDLFRRLDYADKRIHVVVNRYQKARDGETELELSSVVQALDRPVAARVANDFPTVAASINRGTLLFDSAPRARVTQDLADLCALLLGRPDEAPQRGLFSTLFSRRKASHAAG
jgi:pilus assembly protein CpaE